MADPNQCLDAWTHADGIQIALGLLGAWILYWQNKLLHRQNEIMDKQNSQNEILIKMQNQRDWEASIIADSKNEFLRTNGQAGLIQGAAQNLRNRFPNDIKVIVRAYAEIAATDNRFARTNAFLQSMRGYRNEDWPDYP